MVSKKRNNILPIWVRIEDDELFLNSEMTARLFGVTTRTLLDWAKRGMPKEGRGWYNIQKIIEWRGDASGVNDKNMSDEARKLKADAEFREIKARKEQIALDLLEETLIEREEVDRIWINIGIQIKNNLLMWSKSLTPHLAHQDMRNVEAILNRSVYDLLDQISSTGKYSPKKAKKAN